MVLTLVDFQASMPFMIIALAVLAFFGNSLVLFTVLMGFYGWERIARISRGLAIAGANTISNDVEVPLPPQGEATTISFRFQMPPLVPGSYAISATAVTLDASGATDLLHLVTNAIMFQVSSARKVFGLVGLNCHIELD